MVDLTLNACRQLREVDLSNMLNDYFITPFTLCLMNLEARRIAGPGRCIDRRTA